MNPVDMARQAISGLDQGGGNGADLGAPSEPAITHLDREPGNSFLDQIMNRRAGVTEQAKPDAKPAVDEARFQELQRKLDESEARANRQSGDREVLTGMLKQIETLANRPVNVQLPAPQQQVPQLPALPEIDDPDLRAAFQTMQARFDQQLQAVTGQLAGSVNSAHHGVELSNFENALYSIKSAHPDWQIDENAVRAEVTKGIQDRRFVNVNWRKELELAYTAQTAPAVNKELAELRKYKADQEAKIKADQEKQRKNLSQVPSIGGRAGSSGGGGLIADSILADARKAGKRLSWNDFGRQYQKRSRA